MAEKRLDIIVGARDRTAAALQSVQGRIGGLVKSLTSLPGLIAGALGGLAIGKFIKDSLDAINQDERAAAKLEATLRATGGAAGFTADQLKELAGELQQVTTFGDEVTVNALAILATFRQIRGDVFTRASRAALDLSTVLEQDLRSSTLALGRALNDPIRGLTALSRMGITFTEQQQRTIRAMVETGNAAGAQALILDQLEARFGGAAEAVAREAGGRMQQMMNAFGDMFEGFGAIINEVAGPAFVRLTSVFANTAAFLADHAAEIGAVVRGIAQGILARLIPIGAAVINWGRVIASAIFNTVRSIVEFVTPGISAMWGVVSTVLSGITSAVRATAGAVGGAISSLSGVFDWIGGVLTQLRDLWVLAYITMEFAFKNWQDLIALGLLRVAAEAVDFKDTVVWIFGTVIPDLVGWFGRNWREIFTDVGNFTLTVFENLASNIVNIFRNIPALIRGEVSFSDLWTPLAEGFEATLRELPSIAERQQSELSRALNATVAQLEQDLGEAFTEHVQRRLQEIAGDEQAVRDFFSGEFFRRLAAGAGERERPVGFAVAPPEEEEGQAGSAQRRGVEALAITSRFQGIAARFAEGIEPQRQTARNTAELVKTQRETKASIDALVNLIQQQPPGGRPAIVVSV